MKLSFRKVLGVAFIIAALICIYFAFLQQEKYIQGNAEYKKIKQTATDTPSDDSKHTQDFQVDWNTLKTQNPDIVGLSDAFSEHARSLQDVFALCEKCLHSSSSCL